MKYVFFLLESYPLPIAIHLVNEGREVILGVVDSVDALGLKDVKNKETSKEKSQRFSTYKGILKKQPANDVLMMLSRVPKDEQGDYFIFFDYNNMYNISEKVLKMGFKNGLFPTKWYYRMEKERALAKNFVRSNYKDVKVADSHDFKSAADGIKFLQESKDKTYVLKSNGNQAGTKVPRSDDHEEGKKLLIEALTAERAGYEAGGFLLEEKIPNCLEVTPIMVFYNGEPVYSLVEFESKSFGAGDIGMQKGGNLALSVKTPFDCQLNEIAFPKIVYDLAKAHPGLAVFDIGLLYNGEDFYFTEFCAMRYGWDGLFSEMVMRDEGTPFVASYFEDMMAGINPLSNDYGASVRLFNIGGHGECSGLPTDDMAVKWKDDVDNNLFLYQVKRVGKDILSVGGMDLLGVATGASDVLETAVSRAYEVIEGVTFENLYYRPKFDFLSMAYKSSILSRFAAIKPFIEEAKE